MSIPLSIVYIYVCFPTGTSVVSTILGSGWVLGNSCPFLVLSSSSLCCLSRAAHSSSSAWARAASSLCLPYASLSLLFLSTHCWVSSSTICCSVRPMSRNGCLSSAKAAISKCSITMLLESSMRRLVQWNKKKEVQRVAVGECYTAREQSGWKEKDMPLHSLMHGLYSRSSTSLGCPRTPFVSEKKSLSSTFDVLSTNDTRKVANGSSSMHMGAGNNWNPIYSCIDKALDMCWLAFYNISMYSWHVWFYIRSLN